MRPVFCSVLVKCRVWDLWGVKMLVRGFGGGSFGLGEVSPEQPGGQKNRP